MHENAFNFFDLERKWRVEKNRGKRNRKDDNSRGKKNGLDGMERIEN